MNVFNSLLNTPIPINLNYIWNFGSLLSFFIAVQILTGLFLSFFYVPYSDMAFDSILIMTRNNNNTWVVRAIHINSASLIFLFLYLHIFRSLYYGNFNNLHVWFSGSIIFILVIFAAFTGYILVWGQLSYWAATVITKLITAFPLGTSGLMWIWGGFSVSDVTLNRFFILHFLVPLVVGTLSLVHILLLHEKGSTNALGTQSKQTFVPLYTTYLWNDIFGICSALFILSLLCFITPSLLVDSDNYIEANPIQTPTHINPEWYFLWLYAILRCVPNKLAGVLTIVSALLILFLVPITSNSNYCSYGNSYNTQQVLFWSLISTMLLLTWLGNQPVEYPYNILSQWVTSIYFLILGLLIPTINALHDRLITHN